MLAIDVGNTRIKWGTWLQGSLQHKGAFVYQSDRISADLDRHLFELQLQQHVYISSVAGEEVRQTIQQWFHQAWGIEPCFVESVHSAAGVINGYDNPRQLGVDRWVALVAAYNKYRRAVCVIDCGTAVTLDMVNANGQHLGGLIMPGLDMMLSGLMKGTQGIQATAGNACPLGRNTADAVYSGCLQLLGLGIQGMIKSALEKHSHDL
ncbi:MAG: type III pantothenate kinase, partial [Gammaproteobacteria bacterium]